MKINIPSRLLFIAFLLFVANNSLAQQNPLYNIEFVKAVWVPGAANNDPWANSPIDSNILVVFQLTPIDIKDFPPIISEKITYSIDDGNETTMTILKQKERKIVLTVCDQYVKDKNKEVYELVKQRLENYKGGEIKFIAFTFLHPTTKKPNKMSITYGLWEKNNQNVRVEKKYDFTVE